MGVNSFQLSWHKGKYCFIKEIKWKKKSRSQMFWRVGISTVAHLLPGTWKTEFKVHLGNVMRPCLRRTCGVSDWTPGLWASCLSLPNSILPISTSETELWCPHFNLRSCTRGESVHVRTDEMTKDKSRDITRFKAWKAL